MHYMTVFSGPKLWVKADKVLDFVPVVSSLTNATEILSKFFFGNYLASAQQKCRFVKHINNKSYVHCFLGLIPVFGNLIIFIYAVTRPPSPVKALKEQVKSGSVDAMYSLAVEYTKQKNFEKAYVLHMNAAKCLHVPSVMLIAEAQVSGKFFDKPIAKDLDGAISLYRDIKAHPQARYKLGCLLVEKKDFDEAFLHFVECKNNGSDEPIKFLMSKLKAIDTDAEIYNAFYLMTLHLLEKYDIHTLETYILELENLFNNSDNELCKDHVLRLIYILLNKSYILKINNKLDYSSTEIESTLKNTLFYTCLGVKRAHITGLKYLMHLGHQGLIEAQEYLRSRINHVDTPSLLNKIFQQNTEMDVSAILSLCNFGNQTVIAFVKSLQLSGIPYAVLSCAMWKLYGLNGYESAITQALDEIISLAAKSHYLPAISELIYIGLGSMNKDPSLFEYLCLKLKEHHADLIDKLFELSKSSDPSIGFSCINMLFDFHYMGFLYAGKRLLELSDLGIPHAIELCTKYPEIETKVQNSSSLASYINANHIDLTSLDMTYEQLVTFLKNQGNQLEYFSIENADYAADLFRFCPNITYLSAKNCELTDLDIFNISQYNTNLETLKLECNHITSEGARALASGFKKLQILDLNENYICSTGAKAIARGLKGLRILELNSNKIKADGAIAIARNLKLLHTLNLSNNKIGDDGVKEIANNLPLLHTLALSDTGATQDAVNAIARSLSELRKLNLSHTSIGLEELSLIAKMRHLKILILNNCDIDRRTLSVIKCPQETLQTLSLIDNDLGSRGAQIIAKYFPHLRSLNLNGCLVNNKGAKAIAVNLTKLKKLCLDSNDIDFEGAVAIAQNQKGLETLDLSYNPIGDEGVESIARHIQGLKKLSLNLSSVGNIGVQAIAGYLKHLTVLKLSENNIKVEGAKAIANQLKGLEYLDISDNRIGEEGIHAITHQLDKLYYVDVNNCS